ncbi:hypothetical protein F5Y15DRAFT_365380 [Xylariaceae sp. FL0016]|nr:hypothetical protein F5Y15DRAFT_365380 [Xylariaceae sp. FL0016]
MKMLTPRGRSNQAFLTAPPAQARPPRNSYRDSTYGRPASSIYSQPSPEAATFAAHQLRNEVVYADPNEISPPSSPDISSPKHGPNPGDVSPIDETPEMSQLTSERQAPRSNIPTMRRERRQNSLRETQSRERLKDPRPYGHDVRWDPRTGEPTTGPKGRPSQVNPQEFAQGLSSRAVSASPPQNKQPQQSLFGERIRVRREPSSSPQPEPAPRPEWRGASGRTTLVAPVADDKSVAPLNVPPRSDKRAGRRAGTLSPVASSESETASPPVSARGPGAQGGSVSGSPGPPKIPSGKQPQSPSAVPAASSPLSRAYPSPPLSDDNSVPAKQAPIHQQHNAQSAQPAQPAPQSPLSLQIPSPNKAIRRKPAAGSAGHRPDKSWSSSVYSETTDIHPSQAPPGAFPSDWTQPPSRFSQTTAATSHPPSSPKQGLDDAVPPVPMSAQDPSPRSKTAAGASILDRKRPIVPGYEGSPRPSPTEPVRINMDSPYYVASPPKTKARPSGPQPVPRGNYSTLSVASVASVDKVLPLAPPESASQDRVTQLNAKLEALANRRMNINTAIKQMTELMPTDNVLASDAVVRKREEEKRKVEVLRIELADVERESYELGLKLHRAYKRLDRDAEYEPTTLWVRRVTG